VTAEGARFLRARRPEHKRLRYQAILDAARALAERDGVGGVSLAGIAADVGMHKSALLRYFGTREEIFLRLAEDEWRQWGVATVADLDAGPVGDRATEHVVLALSRSLADRPLFCQLLIHSTLTLEHNVSLDAVRSSKVAAMGAANAVADALHRVLPGLGRPACFELLATTGIVAAGLWQAAHPSPVVVALHAESPIVLDLDGDGPLDFPDAVARFIRIYLAGLRGTA
jgi:AcrR family transcriptional regulator